MVIALIIIAVCLALGFLYGWDKMRDDAMLRRELEAKDRERRDS